LLGSTNELLDAAGVSDVELTQVKTITERATHIGAELNGKDELRRHEIFRLFVSRIEIGKTEVHVLLNYPALRDLLGLDDTEPNLADHEHLLVIPAQLRSRGEELKFIITDPGAQNLSCPDPVLTKAVVRAHDWLRSMTEKNVSLSQIAQAEGVTKPYIRCHLKLAFLAPDITRAILDGWQPADLSLERLTRLQKFPLDWDEQRRLFRI
jgi:site-specific DNA recombinase